MTGTQQSRRSRDERSADSRQLILDATLSCLVEEGYARTTTLAIQARAGISRGRLLHHFPSREELLVAACQHLATRHLIDIEGWAATEMPPGAGPDRLDRAIETLWASFREPYFWGAIELWTAARTDPTLRETLLPEERRLAVAIRRVVDTLFGPEIAAHPRYPGTRDLLLTSMRGVAVSYSLGHRDPNRDPHLAIWRSTARALLERPEG